MTRFISHCDGAEVKITGSNVPRGFDALDPLLSDRYLPAAAAPLEIAVGVVQIA